MAPPKHVFENLSEILAGLGVTASEAHVFLYLLQNEHAQRISTIAQRTKQNRTTLYGLLKSLSERGLVSSVEDRGILTYRAIQPHLLVDYIERAKEKLSADIKRIREMVPAIEEIRKSGGQSSPSIQFFHGVEGLKQAYEDTIKNNPSKFIYGFTGAEAIFNEYSIDFEWVEHYIGRRAKAGVQWFDVATDGPASQKMKVRDHKDLRTTKALPPGYKFDIEMATYENKVLIASFAKEHPLAVLIEDEKIAELMKELFRFSGYNNVFRP